MMITPLVPDLMLSQPEVTLKLSSNSTLKPDTKFFTLKDKKTKIIMLDLDTTHIIIGYHPNPSLEQYVCDILVYDVPVKWDNIKLLEHLKA
ncbi:hypothetical protein RclHR1_02400020 [Rhizophagus clarus]|nr:hypothetical protein RclHR1_02400020 [Rhizophagus clarus]